MQSRIFHCVVPFKWLFWERLANKLIKFALFSYALAWLLACTSTQTRLNIPVAGLAILCVYWLSTQLVFSDDVRESQPSHRRRYLKYYKPPRSDYYYKEKVRDPPDRDAWKRHVNAPILESAWESFCGSIIQEWVYDAWYSLLSPDREFPAEVRRLLNDAFAEVVQRAKKIDLRTLLLRDVCDLFTEQLELYRATKSAMGILNEGDLSLAKRDRAFQQEMKTDKTLHAAFYSRDGHYRMIRRMAEGVVGQLLNKEDLERPIQRSLARELVATCVLRSVIMLFTPYNANKVLLSLLTPKKDKKIQAASESQSEGGSAAVDRHSSGFQFEQRVRTSVVLEELANRKAIQKRQNLKGQHRQIPISHSHPNLTDPEEMKKEMEEVGESEITEDSDATPANSSSELKSDLEETDLLDGVKGDSELDGGTPFAPTSLPRTTSPIFPNTTGDDVEPLVKLIDSQVAVEDISFVGHPRARVVAPEISTNGGREFVVFKIRVADQTGEWTVTRRYRNFEALHKFLRDLPAYRELQPRLPPKSFMFQTHKTEVVEQRRIALDKYLQTLLSNETLASNRHVWLFLSDQGCRSFTPDIKVGLVKTIANNVDSARYRIKRSVADSIKDTASKVDLKKENALRLLDGSESSSVSGSVRLDDDTEIGPPLIKTRTQSNDRPISHYSESPMRHNASLPEGLSAAAFSDGRRSPKGRKKTQKTVGFTSLEEDHGAASRLPGDLRNANLLSRFDYQDRDAIGRQVEKDAIRASSSTQPATKPMRRSRSWSRIINGDVSGSEDEEETLPADFDDYSGISVPLYEVADAIFNFPAQKFFRRQVFQVVRQVLSFLAGDAIDVYLNEKIMRLRSEHALAWMIHSLKKNLWPGGVWFTQHQQSEQQKAAPSKGLQSHTYLDASSTELDADEVAKNLEVRLFRHAPAALVRLIGRGSYMRAMKDVYDLLQLPVFVRQMGYGVVEIVLLALFPELKDLFAKIHREARFMPESRR